ncbi:MFS transporter [Streptomyces sp. NPDC023838]|uniref:MFS transporter n=1 Tax=Streptomyces sp. NPDC023838 TaxID=3154325 RepID=UPI0033D044E6
MTHDTHAGADLPGGSQAGAASGDAPTLDPRRWLALIIVLVAGFMDMLDVTIVNVVIPSIQKDLHADYTQIEWVVAGYVLGFAALLITGGRLGDIYGRKKMFLIGVAGFTIASTLCGVASGPGMLIGARFFQGAMAGLMVPQILAIIHVTFPSEERGKVLGIWGGVLGSASVAGLIVGGVLVDANIADLEWRPIFLVNIPVGVGALIAAWFFVRESKSPAAPKLDPIGVVIAVTGILMLVYPLAEGRTLGWPAWTYVLMGGSIVVFGILVAFERYRTRTVGSPLVVLSLFKERAFTAGMLVWTLFWIALGGFFLVWTLYMQLGLGWSPMRAGLTGAAFAVGAAAGSGLAVEVFTPRIGRMTLIGGALLNAAGFAAYIFVAHHYGPGIPSWQMIAPLVVTGFGFGLVVAPMIDAILTKVPVKDAGSASGLLGTTQQVGMALGVALVGVLFFGHLADDSDHGVDKVTPALRQELVTAGVPAGGVDDIVKGFRACVHDRSAESDPTKVPASCQPSSVPGADKVQPILTEQGQKAVSHNFVKSFDLSLWYGIGILLLVALGMFALPREVQARDLDAELEALGEPVGRSV